MPSPLLRYLPYVLAGLAYLAGAFIDIMEIDAAQYAVMTRDMLANGDLMHLQDRGVDYLDKPPLIFWSTALSYLLFGVSTFSYKLPSLLFSVLAIWSTTRLARLHYSERTAWLAGLVLATAQGFMVMNHDVKTDMYLLGSMTFALWQVQAYLQNPQWKHLVLGFAGIGLAMLAKGPLGLVAPALAVGFDLVLKRDWRNLFRWQWLVGLAVTGLVILPFCIGLYQQFGAHGVKFFLWTQSFGRVTGESSWTNDAEWFFFLRTFLWAFLPWTLFAAVAWGRRLRELVTSGFRVPKHQEVYTLGGFTLLFIALSMSKFKLPHYIFIVFPMIAIMTADYLDQWLEQDRPKGWIAASTWIPYGLFALVSAGLILLMSWSFPGAPWWAWVLAIGGLGGCHLAFWRLRDRLWRLLLPTAMGFAVGNVVANAYLYPQLLSYQSSSQAGKYVVEAGIPKGTVYAWVIGGRGMDFYSGRVLEPLPQPGEWDPAHIRMVDDQYFFVYTDSVGREDLHQRGLQLEVEMTFPQFRVANLSLPFLNPSLRHKVVGKRYLLKARLESGEGAY